MVCLLRLPQAGNADSLDVCLGYLREEAGALCSGSRTESRCSVLGVSGTGLAGKAPSLNGAMLLLTFWLSA